MLKILLIIFVIALCVGPILYLAPSTRQKRIAELRQLAAEKGLHLKSVRNPTEAADAPNPSRVTVYSLKWKDRPEFAEFRRALRAVEASLLVRESYEHGAHFEGHWKKVSFAEGLAFEPALRELARVAPPYIVGVEADDEGVGLYWDENTGQEDADAKQARAIRLRKLEEIDEALQAFMLKAVPSLVAVQEREAALEAEEGVS